MDGSKGLPLPDIDSIINDSNSSNKGNRSRSGSPTNQSETSETHRLGTRTNDSDPTLQNLQTTPSFSLDLSGLSNGNENANLDLSGNKIANSVNLNLNSLLVDMDESVINAKVDINDKKIFSPTMVVNQTSLGSDYQGSPPRESASHQSQTTPDDESYDEDWTATNGKAEAEAEATSRPSTDSSSPMQGRKGKRKIDHRSTKDTAHDKTSPSRGEKLMSGDGKAGSTKDVETTGSLLSDKPLNDSTTSSGLESEGIARDGEITRQKEKKKGWKKTIKEGVKDGVKGVKEGVKGAVGLGSKDMDHLVPKVVQIPEETFYIPSPRQEQPASWFDTITTTTTEALSTGVAYIGFGGLASTSSNDNGSSSTNSPANATGANNLPESEGKCPESSKKTTTTDYSKILQTPLSGSSNTVVASIKVDQTAASSTSGTTLESTSTNPANNFKRVFSEGLTLQEKISGVLSPRLAKEAEAKTTAREAEAKAKAAGVSSGGSKSTFAVPTTRSGVLTAGSPNVRDIPTGTSVSNDPARASASKATQQEDQDRRDEIEIRDEMIVNLKNAMKEKVTLLAKFENLMQDIMRVQNESTQNSHALSPTHSPREGGSDFNSRCGGLADAPSMTLTSTLTDIKGYLDGRGSSVMGKLPSTTGSIGTGALGAELGRASIAQTTTSTTRDLSPSSLLRNSRSSEKPSPTFPTPGRATPEELECLMATVFASVEAMRDNIHDNQEHLIRYDKILRAEREEMRRLQTKLARNVVEKEELLSLRNNAHTAATTIQKQETEIYNLRGRLIDVNKELQMRTIDNEALKLESSQPVEAQGPLSARSLDNDGGNYYYDDDGAIFYRDSNSRASTSRAVSSGNLSGRGITSHAVSSGFLNQQGNLNRDPNNIDLVVYEGENRWIRAGNNCINNTVNKTQKACNSLRTVMDSFIWGRTRGGTSSTDDPRSSANDAAIDGRGVGRLASSGDGGLRVHPSSPREVVENATLKDSSTGQNNSAVGGNSGAGAPRGFAREVPPRIQSCS